jgi:hypothetical protein
VSDKVITREGIEVRPGQVWRDLDKRVHRTVTVERVDAENGVACVISNPLNPKARPARSRIAIKRMHMHGQGFALVAEAEESKEPQSP